MDEIRENGSVTAQDTAGDPLAAVPLDQRQHWLTPAMIFGGLEFCVPILMIGASLAVSFGLIQIIPILLIAFVGIQWAGNALNGYMGAKTGRSSSVLARCSFGANQARIIIALVIGIACMGWWGIQTAVTGNSICAMLNIDYTLAENFGKWVGITIATGVIFAIPSVLGYTSMKWTDYIAVPAGLLMVIFGIYLGVKHGGGWAAIFAARPVVAGMTSIAAINMILGMNVSQFVISADYTRNAKPTIRDNIKIPLGIIAVGVPLMMVGAIMAVGQGTGDIVQVMVNLGFPIWGFLVLWLSSWTSQLVNNYSMGLSLSTLFNARTNKGRILLTIAGTAVSLVLSIMGIMNNFVEFLALTALCYAPIAGIMFADFFLRNREWVDHEGWNYMATLALVLGVILGYITSYVVPMGIPAIHGTIFTALVYVLAMKVKASIKPDAFTPKRFLKG